MTPSPRIAAILALAPKVQTAAEIAADHGQIAALLLRQGLCRRIIVTDISAPSLSKARSLFARLNLSAQADFRVGDGLGVLAAGEATLIVIAGLGGLTIAKMLQAGCATLPDDAHLVLQPRPDPPSLRRWLSQNGYTIDAETLTEDAGRYYITLRARRDAAAQPLDEAAIQLGPCLMRDRPDGWQPYLLWRLKSLGAAGEAATGQAALIQAAIEAYATQ